MTRTIGTGFVYRGNVTQSVSVGGVQCTGVRDDGGGDGDDGRGGAIRDVDAIGGRTTRCREC